MAFIGIAVGVGAVASIASSAMSAGAATDAANINAAASLQANQLNAALSIIARGGPITDSDAKTMGLPASMVGQSSAVLPYYLSQTEMQQGANAGQMVQAIQAINGTPQQQAQQFKQILQKYNPQYAQTQQTAADISSGEMGKVMLAEQQPVEAATSALATGRKNSALEALGDTLNNIDAVQARRGFAGDSFGKNMTGFAARRQIGTAAADFTNQADLENALRTQQTKQAGRQLQISSLGLPGQMESQDIARTGAVAKQMGANFNASMAPLSTFNIGPHQFPQWQTPPTRNPIPSAGAIALSGIGQASGTAGNYLLQRQLASNYNAQMNPAAAGAPLDANVTGAGGVNFGAGGNTWIGGDAEGTLIAG